VRRGDITAEQYWLLLICIAMAGQYRRDCRCLGARKLGHDCLPAPERAGLATANATRWMNASCEYASPVGRTHIDSGGGRSVRHWQRCWRRFEQAERTELRRLVRKVLDTDGAQACDFSATWRESQVICETSNPRHTLLVTMRCA